MRALSATLEAAQQGLSIAKLAKIVLTRAGQDTRTYGNDRILSIKFSHSSWSQRARVVLDNSDNALTDLALTAFKGVISKGATGTAGDEYSAQPELWVFQKNCDSSPGNLTCALELIGIPDRMALDKADVDYKPDDDDTKTVKTLLREIAGDTGVTFLAAFNHAQAYDIVFDSEDNVIDSHQPKSRFRVFLGDDRRAKFRELLEKTGCHMRAEDDGKIHIFKPARNTSTAWEANTAYSLRNVVIPTTANNYVYICTSAGTSHATTEPTWPTGIGDTVADGTVAWAVAYDYEYELNADGQHTFFTKSYREQLVFPNKVTVKSFENDDPSTRTGSATSSSDNSLMAIEQTIRATLASNDEATNIAEAVIARYEMWADSGGAEVPMNVGAEVLDFVHIIDSRNGDNRNGNIGELTLYYTSPTNGRGRWSMTFSFGNWTTVDGILGRLGITPTELQEYFSRLLVDNLHAERLTSTQIEAKTLTAGEIAASTLTANEIAASTLTANEIAASTITLNELTIDDIDDVPDGQVYEKVKATSLSGGYIELNTLTRAATASTASEWYRKKGVILDSDKGINLYGGNVALRTFASETAYNAWKDLDAETALTGTQCHVGTDGKIYAGGNSVSLGEEGITIKAESGSPKLILESDSARIGGKIYSLTDGMAVLANEYLDIITEADGGISIGAGTYPGAPTANDLKVEAGAAVSIVAGDRITLGSGGHDPGGVINSVTIDSDNDVNIHSDSDVLINPTNHLTVGAELVLPSAAASCSLGTNSSYWDDIHCVSLDDSHSPAPSFTDALQVLRNMRSIRRTLTTQDVIKEGLGKRMRKAVEKAGGRLELDWKDKSSFPPEILNVPDAGDFKSAKKTYKVQLRRKAEAKAQLDRLITIKKQKLAEGKEDAEKLAQMDKAISVWQRRADRMVEYHDPVTSTKVFDELWLIIKSVQKLADENDTLKARITALETG